MPARTPDLLAAGGAGAPRPDPARAAAGHARGAPGHAERPDGATAPWSARRDLQGPGPGRDDPAPGAVCGGGGALEGVVWSMNVLRLPRIKDGRLGIGRREFLHRATLVLAGAAMAE